MVDEVLSDSGILKSVRLRRTDISRFRTTPYSDKMRIAISRLAPKDQTRIRACFGKLAPLEMLFNQEYLPQDLWELADEELLLLQTRAGKVLQHLEAANLIVLPWTHFYCWRISLKSQELDASGENYSVAQLLFDLFDPKKCSDPIWKRIFQDGIQLMKSDRLRTSQGQ